MSWSLNSGHFRSSFGEKSLSRDGNALPWITYPAIDFLIARQFGDCDILEFGGGQSTKFWNERSRSVVTFETDEAWGKYIEDMVDENVRVYLAPSALDDQERYVADILEGLDRKFDVIIVDGLHRADMYKLAMPYLRETGIVICDNADAEGYGFHDAWQDFPDLLRVDFYGHAPGVFHPHCTTIHFRPGCAFFGADRPVFRRAYAQKQFP